MLYTLHQFLHVLHELRTLLRRLFLDDAIELVVLQQIVVAGTSLVAKRAPRARGV